MQSATLVEIVNHDQNDPHLNEAAHQDTINRALKAIRAHLRMEVAYVSKFDGNQSVFRAVDAPGLEEMIKIGDSHSLDDVYCRHILEGRLPELMPDTADIPLAASMPITTAVPIGRHLSIPLKLSSGEIYGMFCCFGFEPDKTLNKRDVNLMRMFAEFTVHEIERELTAKKIKEAKLEIINNVIREGRLNPEYQPIHSLSDNSLIGFQCHAYVQSDQRKQPNLCFKDAEDVGVADWLQMEVARKALSPIDRFRDDLLLSVKASPEAIASNRLFELIDTHPAGRIIVELSKPSTMEDEDRFDEAITRLKQRGVRLSIDTAEFGSTALQNIFKLSPEIIKLDIELARAMNRNPLPHAINPVLIGYIKEKGCKIIATGDATPDDLETLQTIYGSIGENYYLGQPMGLEEAIEL